MLQKFKTKIKNFLTAPLDSKLDTLIMLESNILAKQNLIGFINPNGGGAANKNEKTYLESKEFSAFSQNGEDGILDFLIEVLGLDSSDSGFERAFVEFGVQNYTESNTRYLLKKRNWQGLVLDGSKENIDFIHNDILYWKHDLEAKCAFITRENINTLLQEYLDSRKLKNIALLSIDIDGVDYFIWEAIHLTPAIVVIEYNALFGSEQSVSVPYRADFDRFKAHYSGLYFGASLKALIALAHTKGYVFIGADSSGTNAFFVLQSLAQKLSFIATYPLEEYSRRHHARQSRDKSGKLDFKSTNKRNEIIAHLPLYTI